MQYPLKGNFNQYSSTVNRVLPTMMGTQNTASINDHRIITHSEYHLYGIIVLVHLASNPTLKTGKHL